MEVIKLHGKHAINLSSLVFFLTLYLSLRACNSRLLLAGTNQQVVHHNKGFDKGKLAIASPLFAHGKREEAANVTREMKHKKKAREHGREEQNHEFFDTTPWKKKSHKSHRDGSEFNLDYVGPRTHPPSHN